MEVAEFKMLRFSLGVTRMDKIRNEYIKGTAQVGKFGEKTREARLRWYGHLRRKDDGYIGRRMLRMELPGKRKRGRPKRRFMDVVKEDMAEVEVTEEDTVDRRNWRKKIRCGDPWWEKPKEEEEEVKKQSIQASRTAKLWLQFMKMMDILRMFLKGEWMGIWAIHIHAMYEMMPYLAASGHNLYTKCIHVYLQKMHKLHETHPEVSRHFDQGSALYADQIGSGQDFPLILSLSKSSCGA